ncbi:MAG TPA: DUF4031 domain-containing protein [Gemmatimonadales bacterium]|jgi:hypothetical protein
MDRENLMVPGWSHVLSSTNDLAELEALRMRVGAPRRAFHLGNGTRPHLDLKLEPRELALRDPAVRVFESTRELVRHWRAAQPTAVRSGAGERREGPRA